MKWRFIFIILIAFLAACSDINDPSDREQVLAIEINHAINVCLNNNGVKIIYIEHVERGPLPHYERDGFVRCGNGVIGKWRLINPHVNVQDDEVVYPK